MLKVEQNQRTFILPPPLDLTQRAKTFNWIVQFSIFCRTTSPLQKTVSNFYPQEIQIDKVYFRIPHKILHKKMYLVNL